MKPIDIIEKWRLLERKTQEEMAAMLGLKTQQNYNDLKTGRTKKISVEIAQKFQQLSGINVLDANGFSREKNVNESNLLMLNDSGDNLTYQERRRAAKNSHSDFLVPLVPAKAQAGYIKSYDQITFLDTLEKYALPPGIDYRGAAWRYFEIEGDSMEPTFFSGDIILASMVPQVDWADIRNFYTYVLLTESNLFIKRIYRKSPRSWVLISDNEKHYAQQLLAVEEVKEIWVFRRHINSKAPPPKKFEIKV